MELDNANQRNRKPQGPNPNWTEEQKKCYEQKLCIHGKDDHLGWKCPSRPGKDKKQVSTAKRDAHAQLPWTTCYDNNCPDHYASKTATKWFLQAPRKSKN